MTITKTLFLLLFFSVLIGGLVVSSLSNDMTNLLYCTIFDVGLVAGRLIAINGVKIKSTDIKNV
jgi:hypothetical protein